MLELEKSMQEKNNRFQREKQTLQIENKRLHEEIERVGSPLVHVRICVCAYALCVQYSAYECGQIDQ